MRGKITTPAGEAAANVKIKVIHEPSGTVTEYTTNDAGAFLAKGLRVGGPYTVIIDSDEYKDSTRESIFLSLGKTSRLNEQLEELNIERIEVSGFKYTQQSGGANSIFGSDIIDNMPSFNRDLKDIVRVNPLASVNGNGELTIAGNNPRSNSLSVDGISQNDDFGLNYGGYPTQQPPVSLDAIEQVSVDFAPFSASKGNFGGGSINAVTKSGTNEFKFKGYYETSTPSMAGDVLDIDEQRASGDSTERTLEEKEVAPIQTEERYGFSVGGPIIKDKLFFFANYSSWRSELDMDYGFGTIEPDPDEEGETIFVPGSATHAYNTTIEQYNRFLSILENEYGFTDSLGGNPVDKDNKLITKLSWNINDSHRLDFTYQWQDDQDERNFGSGGDTVSLASNRYTYVNKFNNFAAKVYSDWNDDFSTQVSLSRKDVTTKSITNSTLGSVKVDERFRGPAYQFGTDPFRHANYAENQNTTFAFDGTYLLGEHEINFGVKYENLRLYNLFAAESLGVWEFDSLNDFEDRKVGSFRGEYDFIYANAYTNNAADTAYDTTRSQIALYIEDTFYPTDDIELTAGIRYERLSSSDKPTLNEAFLGTYGFSNQENLDGLDIILPRVGFQWFATDDLTVKGGVGRFQGGIPNVWYNNPFQVDGITYVDAPETVINDYFGQEGGVRADITSVPQEIQDSLVQGAGSTNYTDPDFELPSSWRAQLGFDYNFSIAGLGNDYKWSAELAYEQKENEAVWKNTAIIPAGLAADGERIIYDSIYSGTKSDNFDIMMTNADDNGRSFIFTTALAKEWDNGLYMSMSYTHQDIEENHVGSSSRAQSNYQYNIVKNRNMDMASRGSYEIEHSFKLNLNYKHDFFEGYTTRFDMFFERRSGRPFSWVMGLFRDDDLGDTKDFDSSAYLPYIPTGPNDPNVNWTWKDRSEEALSWEDMSQLLSEAGISASGTILDRNTATQPWVTTMDVSIKQDIPGFAKGHKAQVYLMIDNFANLLNSDWGVEKRLGFPNQSIYDFAGLDDEGRYKFTNRFGGSSTANYSQSVLGSSAWQAKIGVSYRF
jgi:hypothetical protein